MSMLRQGSFMSRCSLISSHVPIWLFPFGLCRPEMHAPTQQHDQGDGLDAQFQRGPTDDVFIVAGRLTAQRFEHLLAHGIWLALLLLNGEFHCTLMVNRVLTGAVQQKKMVNGGAVTSGWALTSTE